MFRRLKAIFKLLSARLTSGFDLYVRILSCFALGLVVFVATSGSRHDSRFMIRGPQSQALVTPITVITVNRDDVIAAAEIINHGSTNILKALKEIESISDAFYWDPSLWSLAFQNLLQRGAKTVAVALYLGKDTPLVSESKKNVFWLSGSEEFPERNNIPTIPAEQMGRLGFATDPDGHLRHYNNWEDTLAFKTAQHFTGGKFFKLNSPSTINFLGPAGTFKTYSFKDLIRELIPDRDISGHIIVLTPDDGLRRPINTPVGTLSTGEALANIINSYIHNSWIKDIPWYLGTLYLLVILITTLWIVFYYPESVALVFLGFLALGVTVVSVAVFDNKYVWIPIEAPLALIVITYIVITGYRLGESEKHSWKSEQELQYLSEVEKLKNNFLSLISHDLKNPLAKIQGIVDRLLSSKSDQEKDYIKEDLISIRRTSDELRQYITSLLQLTRVEARNIKLNKEVCDINEIIQSAIDRLRPLSDGKNLKILFEQDTLFSMEIDRTLISEVVINLIENAIKYSDFGTSIVVRTKEVDNQVRVEVEDQAGGIDEDLIPKIFDKFFRGNDDKTLKATGTGLGLYLVKYFIELHGGTVFIKSQKGIGSNIGFTLPLEPSEEDTYATEFTRSHR